MTTVNILSDFWVQRVQWKIVTITIKLLEKNNGEYFHALGRDLFSIKTLGTENFREMIEYFII